MKRLSGIAVSMDGNSIQYLPLGNKVRKKFLLLDNSLLDIVVESTPGIGRKELRETVCHLLSKHVPGNTEEYDSDAIILSRQGSNLEILLVIIRRSVLDEIRKKHPRMPMYSREALEHAGKELKPSFGQEIFSLSIRRPLDRFLVASFAVFLLILAIYLGISRYLAVSKQTQEDSRTALRWRDAGEVSDRQKQIQELEKQWQHFEAIRPLKISRLLEYLAILENASLQVDSLSVNGRFFRLQAFAPDALQIGLALENSPVFHAAEIRNIRLHGRNGMQAFTVEGYYAGD